MESDGETGVVGSGIGRVELSICKETEKPKEENIKGGYQVRAEMNELFGYGFETVVKVVSLLHFSCIKKSIQRKMLNPNSEGVPATHLSEGGGADSAPPLVNAVLMAQMS